MKQILRVMTAAVLVVLLSWGSVARSFAQGGAGRPFITKWQGKAGEELKFPIVGTDYKLVIKDAQGKVVKNEEKVTVEGTDKSFYHAFTPTADGVYTVEAGPEGVASMRMIAEREHDYWYIFTSNTRLLEVVQFGTVAWESMQEMFLKCEKMTFAAGIDTPDLTKVTDMRFMFRGCSTFNQPLEKWDVSKVTDMEEMFYGCSAFNQPLEKWDVSKVTRMRGMFEGCSAFNQPLEKWEVSKVTNMIEMFADCRTFNQPLEKWNVSQVTDMRDMFTGCSAFNQPLEKWEVSKVTDMSWMFNGCRAFNQPLGKWKIKTAVGGLESTAMSPSNYSATLAGWAAQSEIADNVHFRDNVRGLIYNNEGKTAREKLIGKGWKFEGDKYQGSGVAITPRELSLELNEEFTLPLEKWGVEEGEKVTLSSSKEGILSYAFTADGKGVRIQGLKVGRCDLTATIAAKEGGHKAYTSTCEVKVYVPVEHITITPESQTLSVNQEITLVANVIPTNATEKRVTWRSSNSEIATVDPATGKVTAKKVGTCTITAKTEEDWSSVKGTCTISVSVEIVSVTGISVTSPSNPLKVGESVTLTAIVDPINATEKGVTWSSSDSEIATVDPETGKVIAKKVGTCTITARTKEEGSSVKGTCTIVVVENNNGDNNGGGNNGGGNGGGNNGGGNNGGSWQPQTPKAVEDAVLASLAVVPNPFTSQLRIENPEGLAAHYELVNAAGVVVLTGAFVATEVIVDTEALAAGVYFVRIEVQNGAKRVVKVVKC